MHLPVPYFRQMKHYTCGVACLRMAAHHFGGQQVEASLTAGQLIIALVSSTALYIGVVGLGHFVIIVGLENNDVIFHDSVVGDNIKVSRARFEVAWA